MDVIVSMKEAHYHCCKYCGGLKGEMRYTVCKNRNRMLENLL